MKKAHKDPIDLDNQIENLISLGLIIEDREYAKSVLKRVSYYRFLIFHPLIFHKRSYKTEN